MFPREAIELGGTLQSCGIGVLSITYEESSPDPCDYLQVSEMMDMDPQVKKKHCIGVGIGGGRGGCAAIIERSFCQIFCDRPLAISCEPLTPDVYCS